MSLTDLGGFLARFPSVRVFPLDLGMVKATAEITDIPELHDRLIAGTAKFLGLHLISNDPVIESSAFVTTVW